MAASDNINSRLFDDLMVRSHGMTIDKALAGYRLSGFSGDTKVYSPDEFDELNAGFKGRPMYDPMPRRERVASLLSKSRPLGDIVKDWAMDHRQVAVSSRDVAETARDLRDLGDAIRGGQTIQSRIYRGAKLDPATESQKSPTKPISFTDDHHVARSFAGRSGQVHRIEPGQARGLYVPDFMSPQRTVGSGRRPEREWLIDPATISGR